MDAKKCDRCGKFYDYYTIKFGNKNIFHTNSFYLANDFDFSKKYDICPECLNEFVNWLNEFQVETQVKENES